MITCVSDNLHTPWMKLPVSSQTLVVGELVVRDTVNSVVIPATSSVGDYRNIIGVTVNPVASTDTVAEVMPIIASPSQEWEIDCTNAVAVDQLLKNQGMTDSKTLANVNTQLATALGIFVPTRRGSTSTKLIGYFTALGVDAE